MPNAALKVFAFTQEWAVPATRGRVAISDELAERMTATDRLIALLELAENFIQE